MGRMETKEVLSLYLSSYYGYIWKTDKDDSTGQNQRSKFEKETFQENSIEKGSVASFLYLN
jgi:hypothetical protein